MIPFWMFFLVVCAFVAGVIGGIDYEKRRK